MQTLRPTILAATFISIALTACGNGGGMATGSLFGKSSTEPSGLQPPKPVSSSDRALFVGATVARAQRCGFYFNPDEIRNNFIASEQQSGATPDAVQKATREFDFTRQKVAAAAAQDDTYCTEGRTRETKAALTRQLAGDFNPPQARQTVNVGWFDHQKKNDTLDGNKIFDASQKRQPTMGGE